jgi:hypothetical protein
MHLYLRESSYTDRLASFLTSLGQHPVVAAADRLDLGESSDEEVRMEVEIYLRVWRVLHPDSHVELA